MLLNLWTMLPRNVFVTIFQLQLWQKIRGSNLGRLLKHFIVNGISSFFSTVTTRSHFYLYRHDRRALSESFKYRNKPRWRCWRFRHTEATAKFQFTNPGIDGSWRNRSLIADSHHNGHNYIGRAKGICMPLLHPLTIDTLSDQVIARQPIVYTTTFTQGFRILGYQVTKQRSPIGSKDEAEHWIKIRKVSSPRDHIETSGL